MVWVGPFFVEIAYGAAPADDACALAAARCSDRHQKLADPHFELLEFAVASVEAAAVRSAVQQALHQSGHQSCVGRS
jgi:hypothetical protein